MSFKRFRQLMATAAVVLFVPGGGTAAVADAESAAAETARTAAAPQAPGRTAEQRQRRAEATWLAEQVRAAGRRPLS